MLSRGNLISQSSGLLYSINCCTFSNNHVGLPFFFCLTIRMQYILLTSMPSRARSSAMWLILSASLCIQYYVYCYEFIVVRPIKLKSCRRSTASRNAHIYIDRIKRRRLRSTKILVPRSTVTYFNARPVKININRSMCDRNESSKVYFRHYSFITHTRARKKDKSTRKLRGSGSNRTSVIWRRWRMLTLFIHMMNRPVSHSWLRSLLAWSIPERPSERRVQLE